VKPLCARRDELSADRRPALSLPDEDLEAIAQIVASLFLEFIGTATEIDPSIEGSTACRRLSPVPAAHAEAAQ
jgi:hypothetical protein